MDLTLISFWLISFAALYFLGPISIYFIGILAILMCLCSSTLSSLTSSSVRVIQAGELDNVKLSQLIQSQGLNGSNIDPANKQCGGVAFLGEPDGFDMTPEEVYAAFRRHPYDNENLGYGYYDGYDYVL
ncbi:MAG: hypothetical protein WD512_03815 [Candidatus Paceibacterota bacterium]